jgi:hypothetical protein
MLGTAGPRPLPPCCDFLLPPLLPLLLPPLLLLLPRGPLKDSVPGWLPIPRKPLPSTDCAMEAAPAAPAPRLLLGGSGGRPCGVTPPGVTGDAGDPPPPPAAAAAAGRPAAAAVSGAGAEPSGAAPCSSSASRWLLRWMFCWRWISKADRGGWFWSSDPCCCCWGSAPGSAPAPACRQAGKRKVQHTWLW